MTKILKTFIVLAVLLVGATSAQAEPSTYLSGYANWAQGAFGQK